jgi:hypothetical protein
MILRDMLRKLFMPTEHARLGKVAQALRAISLRRSKRPEC